MAKKAKPKSNAVHAGTILLRDWLKPNGISQYRLGMDVGVQPERIHQICRGTRALSPDTALRLARYFGNPALYWMSLQAEYELQVMREKLGDNLARECKIREKKTIMPSG